MYALYKNNAFIIAFNPLEDSAFFVNKGFPDHFFWYTNTTFTDRLIKEADVARSDIPFLMLMTRGACDSLRIIPDWRVHISLQQLYAGEINSKEIVQSTNTAIVTNSNYISPDLFHGLHDPYTTVSKSEKLPQKFYPIDYEHSTEAADKNYYKPLFIHYEKTNSLVTEANVVLQMTIAEMAGGKEIFSRNFNGSYNNKIAIYYNGKNGKYKIDTFLKKAIAISYLYESIYPEYKNAILELLNR
ncbi:MAG: hypothetical protein ABJA78_07590 [Ferruginibacter sp.]